MLGRHDSSDSSSSVMHSHISFWCSQIGSAFLRINSSGSISSMVDGRLTRFCFPLTKMVMYSFRLLFFSAFSAAVSFRLGFAIKRGRPLLPGFDDQMTSALYCSPVLDPRRAYLTLGTSPLVYVRGVCSINIPTDCRFYHVGILSLIGPSVPM